jgi:anti-sigma regulatory factor (Ser/Thr protein kinase)
VTERLEMQLAPDLTEIGRLAEAVEAFGERNELPMKALFSLNLAFDELITNTISYGLAVGSAAPILVTMTVEGGELVSVISDAGIPFDPFADAPPPDLTSDVADRAIGGLGVHLVKTLIDRFAYRRDGDRNIITLAQKVG